MESHDRGGGRTQRIAAPLLLAAMGVLAVIALCDVGRLPAGGRDDRSFRTILDELSKKEVRPKEEEVLRALLGHIETELKKKETPLTPGGKDYLGTVLRKGALQLLKDAGNSKKLAKTDDNVQKLVGTLAELGKDEKRVEIQTIDRAMSRLCPLYPFCRSKPWTNQPSLASRSPRTSTLC